jgi:hypothetical protein
MASVMNANSALAVQLNFTFTQEGFEGGGILTGSFTGEDQDVGEEAGTLDRDEITDFSLSFRGNSIIPSFNQVFADLGGEFELSNLNSPTSSDLIFSTGGTPVIFENQEEEALVGRNSSQTTVAIQGEISVRSEQPLTLVRVNPSTPVPEPSSVIGLAGFTLLSLGKLTKKKLLSQRTGV